MLRLKKSTIRRRQSRADKASTYTEWGIRYPWHVSDTPYPKDKNGNCACKCVYCRRRGEHKATRKAHLKS